MFWLCLYIFWMWRDLTVWLKYFYSFKVPNVFRWRLCGNRFDLPDIRGDQIEFTFAWLNPHFFHCEQLLLCFSMKRWIMSDMPEERLMLDLFPVSEIVFTTNISQLLTKHHLLCKTNILLNFVWRINRFKQRG